MGSMTGGRYSRCGSQLEKPPLRSGVHCIGVRTPSRSPSQMLSPMPILDGVHDRWQVQPLRVAVGEAAVAVRGPLHRGADAVAVAQPDVVAHADLRWGP